MSQKLRGRLVEGEHEARGRVGPAREWFDALDAPDKRWIELPQSGHRPHFEQPDLFAAEMRTVRSEPR
jgi:pimeloyl-ACP methyl ester carboxylesterase